VIQVSPFWQQAIAGLVILVSVVLNSRSQQQAGRQILERDGARAHGATT
jgi:rhamnose transport system permease protein